MQHEIKILFSPADRDLAAKLLAILNALTDEELSLCEKVVFCFLGDDLAGQTIQMVGCDGIVVFPPNIRKCTGLVRVIAHEVGHVLSMHHLADQESHGQGRGLHNTNASWEVQAEDVAGNLLDRIKQQAAVGNNGGAAVRRRIE
jgi:hypothetical protein